MDHGTGRVQGRSESIDGREAGSDPDGLAGGVPGRSGVRLLFRVRNDVADSVRPALDREIEAPVVVDARLPDILPLIVFLGTERRMVKIAREIIDLLDEGFLH